MSKINLTKTSQLPKLYSFTTVRACFIKSNRSLDKVNEAAALLNRETS